MVVRYEMLCDETLADVVCCPGGLEISGKSLGGDHREVLRWRRRMVAQGLQGMIAYDETGPRGFAEFMPADSAPIPVYAPGAAVLLCYHWAGTTPEDPEHLARERDLIERVVGATNGRFSGLVAQGWSHEVHFPISFLKTHGFQEVRRQDDVALMWRPASEGAAEPTWVPTSYAPANRAEDGVLAVDAAFSARCPYSLHHERLLRDTVAAHPLRRLIELTLHRIDTREQALSRAVSTYDWTWLFFNGDAVNLFAVPRDGLADALSDAVQALSR